MRGSGAAVLVLSVVLAGGGEVEGDDEPPSAAADVVEQIDAFLRASLDAGDVSARWARIAVEPLDHDAPRRPSALVLETRSVDGASAVWRIDDGWLRESRGGHEPLLDGPELIDWPQFRSRVDSGEPWLAGTEVLGLAAQSPRTAHVALASWLAWKSGSRDLAWKAMGPDLEAVQLAGDPDVSRALSERLVGGLSSWLIESQLRSFGAGDVSADDLRRALSRVTAASRQEAPAIVRTWIAALSGDGHVPVVVSPRVSELSAALRDGVFPLPACHPSAAPVVFDDRAPLPVASLLAGGAAERWDAVPALLPLIGSSTPSRVLAGLGQRGAPRPVLVGHLAEMLLVNLTHGEYVPHRWTAVTDGASVRRDALRHATAWWEEVLAEGLAVRLRTRARAGDAGAAEDLWSIAGSVDVPSIEEGLEHVQPHSAWRFLRLAARSGEPAALQAVRDRASLPREAAPEVVVAMAVQGDPEWRRRLDLEWDAARAAAVRRTMGSSGRLVRFVSAAVAESAEFLPEWLRQARRLPAESVGWLAHSLRWKSASGASQEAVRAFLAACLFDERDLVSPPWIGGFPAASRRSGCGSRICDVAAERLLGDRPGFAAEPLGVREQVLRAARAEFAQKAGPGIDGGVAVGLVGNGGDERLFGGVPGLDEVALRELLRRPARDPTKLFATLSELGSHGGGADGSVAAAWERSPEGGDRFWCSLAGLRETGRRGTWIVVSEGESGVRAVRHIAGIECSEEDWRSELGVLAAQLAADRACGGPFSLRLCFQPDRRP